jgi:SH3 domain protein
MVFRFILILAFGICFFTNVDAASTAYVTDSFKISLRRGPSIENKILEFLPSGMPVDVLEEEDGWSRVTIMDSDDNKVTGWVLSRYLIHRLPWEDQSARLTEQLAQIKMDMVTCKNNLEEVSIKEQELTEIQIKFVKTIDTLQKDYEVLKTESADYLKMKMECESHKETAGKLKKENDKLKNLDRISFFGLGAFILLSGLAIGVVIGKRNRKRNSLSHKLLL